MYSTVVIHLDLCIILIHLFTGLFLSLFSRYVYKTKEVYEHALYTTKQDLHCSFHLLYSSTVVVEVAAVHQQLQIS